MNANKQLLNLVGILVVVVLLVAGVALIAMPMYTQSQTTDAQTRTVTGTNSVYEQQIASLTQVEQRIGEIDDDLAALRAEVAASPQLDDVHEIIAAAAKSVDARVESVLVGDPEPWAPREGTVDAQAAAAPAAPAEESEDAADTADDASPPDAGTAAPEGATPQRQVLITITLDLAKPFGAAATDAEDDSGDSADSAADGEPEADELAAQAEWATDFVDALGKGPRLISPINVAYTDGKLVVSALTYFRAEGS